MRMRAAVWLGLLASAVLIGCGSGGGAPSSGEDRNEHYKAYAVEFGNLLLKNDFEAAYAKCSSHLKKKMSLEAFAAAHKRASRDYGKAAKVDGSVNFTKPELLADQKGWPDGAKRQARVFVRFYKEADDNSMGDYCCALNIVQEDGQDLVAVFEYCIN